MAPGSVECVVTSPPYNAGKSYESALTEQEFRDFTQEWLDAAFHVLNPKGGTLFVNCGTWSGKRAKRFFIPPVVIACGEQAGFRFASWINWVKGTLEHPQVNSSAWGDYKSCSPFMVNGDEPVLMFKRGRSRHRHNDYEHWLTHVHTPWVFAPERGSKLGHPAPFPPELPRRCIMMTTLPGDTVLDPFAGSGTTGVVCRESGRECVLIEISEPYIDKIVDRLEGDVTVEMTDEE